MDRRKFVSALGLGLGAAALAGCGQDEKPAASDNNAAGEKKAEALKWDLVTTWPKNYPGLGTGANRFAERVNAMSGGRLTVKVHGAGELVPATEVFDAVRSGSAQMGHSTPYYWKGKHPAMPFFTTIPFGLTAWEMNGWLNFGGGQELWEELYEPFNLQPLACGNSGTQMAGWFNKEINSVADLEGLKMRIPGLGGKVFAKAGGNPVLLAGSEVYTALERNTIDATEWIGPYHDQRLGLYRAAKHYYYPGWHEPGTVLELTVNKRAWDSLSADLQAIITHAAESENVLMLSEMEQKNMSALKDLQARDDIEIHRFPDDVLARLQAMTNETLAEEAAANPAFKRIYKAYQTFRQQDDAWTAISERSYLAIEQN